MADKKLKNSLKNQMLKMTLIPLILMTIAIVAVSGHVVRKTITDQIEKELIRDAEVVGFIFDEFYEGEYRVEESEDANELKIYKGDQLINSNDSLMNLFSEKLDVDVSIFYKDVRIISTLADDDGNSAIGTQASSIVKKEVIDSGQSAFYDNVMVYDQRSYAYYTPLKNDKDEVIGMIAVCRASGDVINEVIRYELPVVGICVVVALFFGIIMIRYNRHLANRIFKMDKYMNSLANGDFDKEMPRELMQLDDELRHLANDGKRMARSIKTLVEYDALTELNNRRSADKKLEEIRIRSVEQGIKYCICISDIDFFKKVNDTYGHEMGDEVLKMVSAKLKSGMVGKGFVARWGGEEFLIIFENRELDIARRELEIIMDDIRTIWVPDSDRQITMSFGLTFMSPEESVDETLKRADDNLYEAKETGRNQIVCK
ncbi:diguanylate cyclase domain-containing protein [Pseudobutyrivibrio sp.]|uniref:diguanylate cyclase domain-containing protein n=1 Tax=Pseudobutyrivibrio sp. TaxID=2014367 RepID=UPI001DC773D3|nr:diguanylate cyclase [Pseudobutyrivibrio sp.]MBE5911770.1 diguanylate cyclase [Pseudobutyrivibrio sp.]